MKKRLLAILLSLMMVLSLLPVGVFATDEGNTVANALPDAVDGTITLTSDVALSNWNSVNSDTIIDLANHTLELTEKKTVTVAEGKRLTIKNGSIVAKASGLTGTEAVFAAEKNATITFDNVQMETTGAALFPAGNAAAVNVLNSYIKAGTYAVGTNANVKGGVLEFSNDIKITLKDSQFTSTGYTNNDGDTCTVMINVPGELNVDNCEITGRRQAVLVRGGTANIENSKITLSDPYTGNDAGSYDEKVWGQGNNLPMAALVVGNRVATSGAYKYPAVCTLKKTTVAAPENYRTVYVYQIEDKTNERSVRFVYDELSDVGTVVNGEGSVATAYGPAVAQVGEGNLYTTLAAAIAAANNGETVTLMKDVNERVSISKNLVLDLNGKTLTGEDLVNSNKKHERIALTVNAGTVEVKNGVIDGRVNAYDSADLTIDADVTVKNSYNASGYDCFGIVVWGDGNFGQNGCKTPKLTVNGKVIMEKGGVAISTNGNDKSCAVVTINDGAVISTTEDGAIYLPSGKLTMNGGTVSGPTGIQICAGNANITSDFKLNNGTVIATGADQRTSKGTGDGLIPDGAAISVVNRNYPNGVPSVTIDGGSFSSANSDAVLAYTWSKGTASEWTDAKTYVTINDGYFTSDPTAYKADGKYVISSDKDGYPYMISDTEPAKEDQKIIVIDKTETTVNGSISTDDQSKIEAVKDKTNVDGVAEAVRTDVKTSIVDTAKTASNNVPSANVNSTEIEVKVGVSVTEANLNKGTMTFVAVPVATVKVNGTELKDSENKTVEVPVSNDMLNGKPITVKLPLPTVDGELFTPKQIKHTSADGSVEYFLDHSENGARVFTIENDCAVFTITKFSTFELSGTQTYVAPVYTSTPITKKDVKFDDVDVNAYYAPAVKWAVENKITAGKTDKLFAPDDTCTRGEMITFLWNAAGKPAAKNTTNPFTDVNAGAFYYDAVLWAVSNGITSGTSDTTFSPDNTVSRAQVVAFLYNYANKPAAANSTFSDVAADAYYAPAVGWAAAQKITSGTGNNTFSPENDCTRAQIVTFLYNDLAK